MYEQSSTMRLHRPRRYIHVEVRLPQTRRSTITRARLAHGPAGIGAASRDAARIRSCPRVDPSMGSGARHGRYLASAYESALIQRRASSSDFDEHDRAGFRRRPPSAACLVSISIRWPSNSGDCPCGWQPLRATSRSRSSIITFVPVTASLEHRWKTSCDRRHRRAACDDDPKGCRYSMRISSTRNFGESSLRAS